MINIDRNSGVSVPEQLAEQLRFLIASGHYKVNETLPPTRKMGEQVGISFHTVRKAYQILVGEGVLEVQQGSGYRVTARTPLSNEERLEKGADIVKKMLLNLVGLGLDEGEIEYLVQDQLTLLNLESQELKLMYVAPYLEMAENCAEHISNELQMSFEPATPNLLQDIQDADYIFCPTSQVRRLNESFPKIDVMGMLAYLTPDTLDRIARLLNHETLGLVTFHAGTIPHLMGEIQEQTGFNGQIFGASLEDGTAHLNQFIDQIDMIVYTPLSRRRVLPFTKQGKANYMISHIVSEPSLKAIQQLLPSL